MMYPKKKKMLTNYTTMQCKKKNESLDIEICQNNKIKMEAVSSSSRDGLCTI